MRPDARLGLALIGAALGVSQTINGAYNESAWAPIALGALAVGLALAIGLPRRPPLAALLPLLGLSLWSLISSGWSDSSDVSHIAADRWLLYAAAFVVLWWGIGERRRVAAALLAGCSAGVLGVAVWMLIRMLAGHGPALFLGTRLDNPLGYVNGQAAYLLAGAWPCLALAERRSTGVKAAALAGAGIGGVVLLTGIGLLTQSRSFGVAVIGTTLVLLAAIPGRRRRASAVLVSAATIAVIYSPLSHVWRHPNATGLPTVANTRSAGLAIIFGGLAAGALWAVAVGGLERLAPQGSQSRARALTLTTGALAALGVAAVVALGINAGTIGHRIHTQYEAFVHLAPSPGSTRLFSGGGNRYDYWRVAWNEFRSAPVIGVGAGNYQPGYYLHRRTNESITQPHSIELQTLAETGLIGALLLAAFLGAVAIGLRRTGRAARTDPLARTVAVAGGGIFIGWLIQTSVDWMHLIPGLTGIALAAAASLLATTPERPPVALASRARIALIAASAVIAAAGAVAIAPRVLSLHAQTLAQKDLANRRPRAAIIDATTALNYDSSSVQALILRAAGFARLHDFPATLTDLRVALSDEPRTWPTWALLGDLFTRRGDRTRAHAAYARALSLDPLDSTLQIAVRSSAAPTRQRGNK